MKIRCRVLQPLKADTKTGRVDLSPGDTIEVDGEVAAPLIEEGKLTPVERLPYKLWSELLQEHILVCETERDKAAIPNPEGLVTYGPSEIRELSKLKGKREELRAWHEAKKILKGDILRVDKRR